MSKTHPSIEKELKAFTKILKAGETKKEVELP